MLNVEIFAIADMAAALMLAAGFLVAYFVDRKLTVFRWWAAFYALVGLSFITIVNRPLPEVPWAESVAWILLYSAAALASFGMHFEGENRIAPHLPIAVGGAVLATITGILIWRNASHAEWVLWGVAPTITLALWAVVNILRQKPLKRIDLAYAAMIIAGAAMLGVRSVFFATTQTAPRPPIALPQARPPLGQPLPPLQQSLPPLQPLEPFAQGLPGSAAIAPPLIISLATILILVGLAIVLILRISLKAVDQMRERSTTDAMTGLLNRATFDERAAELIAGCHAEKISAVVLDIDHFKRINDTCGHATGDRVIAALGAIIVDATLGRSLAGRIGGEEFAILVPGANITAARLLAEALRTRLAASDFDGEIPFPVSLSAGVATRRRDESLHTLIARADEALYAAKNSGRNRVVSWQLDQARELSAQTA